MRFSADQYLLCWKFTYPLRWTYTPSLKRISVDLFPHHAPQKFSLASWSVSYRYLMQMHMQEFYCHLWWWHRHAHLCASQATHFHTDVSTLARILSCFSPVMMCFMCLLHVLLLSSIEPASLHFCMCLQISSYLKQENKNCSVLPSNCCDNKNQLRPVCLMIFVGM
jgi:hypothetical protein